MSNLDTLLKSGAVPANGLIILGWRGSIAHGMYVPKSDPNSIDDKDVMGVYVGSREHYLGFGRQEVVERFVGEWDAVSYEVRKFVSLLLKQNPNVLSLLWLPENGYLLRTPAGHSLIANRRLFVSKAAYHSFTGYAHSQLKRMTHLNQKTLDELRNRRCDLADFGCSTKDGELTLPAGASDQLVELKRQHDEIRGRYFHGYMGDKRRQLVEQHGYDTKNAAHLVRLLRMCYELLTDGVLRVQREDAQELLSIKLGEWELAKVMAEANRLRKLTDEAFVRSKLPDQPNRDGAEKLLISIVEESLNGNPNNNLHRN